MMKMMSMFEMTNVENNAIDAHDESNEMLTKTKNMRMMTPIT